MKKVFQVLVQNKKPDRQVEAIRYEINKYLARERRKTLPETADYWDFDCRFGETESVASSVTVLQIKDKITEIVADNKTSFYVEILAKPGFKQKT